MPPHNLAAETPQEVYDINDSILVFVYAKIFLCCLLSEPLYQTNSVTIFNLVVSIAELVILKNVSDIFTEATPADIAQWRAENK